MKSLHGFEGGESDVHWSSVDPLHVSGAGVMCWWSLWQEADDLPQGKWFPLALRTVSLGALTEVVPPSFRRGLGRQLRCVLLFERATCSLYIIYLSGISTSAFKHTSEVSFLSNCSVRGVRGRLQVAGGEPVGARREGAGQNHGPLGCQWPQEAPSAHPQSHGDLSINSSSWVG